jgi:hypothetical protein
VCPLLQVGWLLAQVENLAFQKNNTNIFLNIYYIEVKQSNKIVRSHSGSLVRARSFAKKPIKLSEPATKWEREIILQNRKEKLQRTKPRSEAEKNSVQVISFHYKFSIL